MLSTTTSIKKGCYACQLLHETWYDMQPCGHLLGKGRPFGSFVCDAFLCYCNFPIWWPESGVAFDCMDSLLPDFYLMHTYAKFYQNILFGSRVISIFPERPRTVKMMLGNSLSPFHTLFSYWPQTDRSWSHVIRSIGDLILLSICISTCHWNGCINLAMCKKF